MSTAAQQAMDDPEARELFIESWPKVCGCGQSFTEEQWEELQYCGVQKVPPTFGMPDMELRNCSRCSSTMAISVPGDFVQKD